MLNEFEENGGLPPELMPLHQQLMRNSEAWQSTIPSTAHLSQFLDQLTSDIASPMQHIQGDVMQPQSSKPPVATTPPVTSHRFMRTFVPATVAVLVVILGALVFHTLSASHASTRQAAGPGATPTATLTQPSVIAPQPANLNLPLPANGFLGAISMATATDGWAIGGVRVPDTGGATAVPNSFLLHYHDGVWTRSTDSFTGMDIGAIAMITPDDGWAVGQYDLHNNISGAPILLHYTQGHWHQVAFPSAQGTGAIFPTAIFMASPTFGWIKGTQQLPSTTHDNKASMIVFVYHDGQWSQIPTPFPVWNGDISMVSADEGWAVNNIGSDSATFAHYQHGTWTNVTTAPITFGSLSMASATDGWAVARTGSEVYHFNGTQWQKIPATLLDPTAALGNLGVYVYATRPGEMWLTSTNEDDTLPGDQRQYAGSLFHVVQQHWQIETLPVSHINIIAVVTDADGGAWALGWAENPSKSVILYKNRGTWMVYGQG